MDALCTDAHVIVDDHAEVAYCIVRSIQSSLYACNHWLLNEHSMIFHRSGNQKHTVSSTSLHPSKTPPMMPFAVCGEQSRSSGIDKPNLHRRGQDSPMAACLNRFHSPYIFIPPSRRNAVPSASACQNHPTCRALRRPAALSANSCSKGSSARAMVELCSD